MDKSEVKYGYCKRTQAWVPRDAMQGIGIQVYGLDGVDEKFTLRLAPEAHADMVARLRELQWDRVLKTRTELEAEGARIEDLELEELAETEVWYRSRHGVAETNQRVAHEALKDLLTATSLDEQKDIVTKAMPRFDTEAFMEALREMKVPRWDRGVARQADPVRLFQAALLPNYTVVDAHMVSANLDEALIVAIVECESGSLSIETCVLDHGLSELAHRAAGKLQDDGSQVNPWDVGAGWY
jgi:hypothetical protein